VRSELSNNRYQIEQLDRDPFQVNVTMSLKTTLLHGFQFIRRICFPVFVKGFLEGIFEGLCVIRGLDEVGLVVRGLLIVGFRDGVLETRGWGAFGLEETLLIGLIEVGLAVLDEANVGLVVIAFEELGFSVLGILVVGFFVEGIHVPTVSESPGNGQYKCGISGSFTVFGIDLFFVQGMMMIGHAFNAVSWVELKFHRFPNSPTAVNSLLVYT
jgi:hypothetical protein